MSYASRQRDSVMLPVTTKVGIKQVKDFYLGQFLKGVDKMHNFWLRRKNPILTEKDTPELSAIEASALDVSALELSALKLSALELSAGVSSIKPARLSAARVAWTVLGTMIISFGIYNIHRQADVTEGGVLGMILLLNHWTGISASILSPALDLLCYALAVKYLGKGFIKTSIIAVISIAVFFKLWELFPPVLPDLSNLPLVAALAGGVFVGVGVGIIIRQGGSSGGDDALALAISKITHCRIAVAYLATDMTVLLLSLSYIPLRRILYSVVTVVVSSLIIDFIQNFKAGVKIKAKL